MDRIEIETNSWNRFITRNLVVEPDLVGIELDFSFENQYIKIKLPGLDQLDRGSDHNPLISVGESSSLYGHPLEYDINLIDISVFGPSKVKIPQTTLNRNANACDLFTEYEQKELNRVAGFHRNIAEKAFEYWVKVVRWICDSSRIGRPKIRGYHSGWGTYLQEISTYKTIWIESQIIALPGYTKNGVDQWNGIEKAVQNGMYPPIFFELNQEAEEQIEREDFNRAIIDLAIACETYLRSSILKAIPSELDETLVKYISEANIRQYIDRFFSSILGEEQRVSYVKLKNDLVTLFEIRNRIMHRGHIEDLTREFCDKCLQARSELFKLETLLI